MNKSEMKSVMESIEKKLKGQKSFSCMAYSNKPAWDVLDELYQGGHESFDFNGVRYVLKYNPSVGTIGNRTSTPEYVVKRQTSKSIFDADQVLAHKEITVRDWMGGDSRVEKCGLVSNKLPLESNKDITSVVTVILTNTDYNVMVQRHDTGDATIWIDNKRFGQR